MDKFETLRNIALPYGKRAASDICDEGKNRTKCISERTMCTVEAIGGEDDICCECKEYSTLHLDTDHQMDETSALHDKESLRKFSDYSSSLMSLDTSKLNTFLIKLDDKNRTCNDDLKTREIVSATEDLIALILSMIGEIDPRFQSTCIKSGSFYDGLKIGQADEFDFVAKIESLSKRNILEARESKRKKGFVYMVFKDEETMKNFSEFIIKPDSDECLRKDDNVLDVNEFQRYFCALVRSALQRIHIPENFIDSDNVKDNGYLSDSWKPFQHGPSATLRVAYVCKCSSEVIDLDIDIVPSIAYPDENFRPPIWHLMKDRIDDNVFLERLRCIIETEEILLVPFAFDLIQKSDKRAWHYFYSNTWRVSFSSLEKAIFGMYDICSTEKRLFRSLKVLKEMFLQNSPETEVKSGSIGLKLQEPPNAFVTSCSVEAICMSDSDTDEATDNILAWDTASSSSDSSNKDEDDGLPSFIKTTYRDNYPKVSSSSSTTECNFAKNVVDEAMPARESLTDSSRTSLEIFKLTESESKGHTNTGNIACKDYEPSTNDRHMKTVGTNDGDLTNCSDSRMEISYEKHPCFNVNYSHCEQYQEEMIYLRQSVVNAEETTKRTEHVSVRLNESAEDDRTNDRQMKTIKTKDGHLTNESGSCIELICQQHLIRDANYPHYKQCQEEIIYLRQSVLNAEETKPKIEHQSLCNSTENDNRFEEIPNYRHSKPLIKTYIIKMLFFAMKAAFPDDKEWKEDKLSTLVLLAMQMLYFAFCSKEKGFLNFWFQDFIENRTRDSTSLEILHTLEEVVNVFRNI
ncbi:hypothetical protein ACJMK2_000683 [Sinanodonta woodiana]|uniref:Mab-21-like nucleotidyltransferase domain-containing protein n=1 Tax=Sinanodonta woodiana TaxID=1069815 RepID=A0ABD3XTH9_SINWO